MYVPLLCKSNYSFLEGASHPAELVEQCVELGLDRLALCDRDGMYGVVEAHVAAEEHDIELIVGSQITVEDGSTIVLLAQSRDGYANLCRLVTTGRRRCEKGSSQVGWGEVADRADGVLALWGGRESLLADREARDEEVDRVAGLLGEAFGDRLYALVCRHRRPEEADDEAALRRRARRLELPLVAAQEVLYHHRDRRPLQDLLVCIDHGVTIHEAGDRIEPNAEHALKPPEQFDELFADLPIAVERTARVAARCDFSLDDIHYRYPSQTLPDGTTSADRLRRLTYQGAEGRYDGQIPDDVADQLDRELGLIEELDYCGYFLSMHEIVEYCRDHDILCQGRGSAANSAVCYCLGITAVDPVRMDLLFERFISRERNEPPDIDLDIEHDRREEVIQWVYERYGRRRAAMVANVIRYRTKSAVRDVGKALGVSQTALDRLAKLLPHRSEPDPELLAEAGLDPEARIHRLLWRGAVALQDFPRHLSIHPGGFLLGEEPVDEIVPVENATKEGRTVIQWDKYDVEEMELFKVDLLGLGALTHLHNCFDLIAEHHGVELSMATIPAGDEATYDMICQADTVGVFQIESRAQMNMLPRLQPRNYYDLVIEISIIRPGPITGDMVHPYLKRRAGKEEVVYPHESLKPVLQKTLGIPLFQEQVMKLAVVAADYTPGEADQLRRDMGMFQQRGKIERHRRRMKDRMLANGIEEKFADRIFKQLEGFASYGFPESHAASFALIAYATSYLRCHYLPAFVCALLNSLPMGFYSRATIVEDARRKGVEVRPVDVTRSRWASTLEPSDDSPNRRAIRMGAEHIDGFREANWQSIAAARRERDFEGLVDFLRRTDLGEESVARLAEAGALEAFDLSRREALWLGRGLVRTPELPLELGDVLDEERPAFRALETFETINWDYRTAGHSTRGHPLEPLRGRMDELGLPTAEAIGGMADGLRTHYAGLVICRQRPSTGSGVVFMTLEDETGFANVILWPDVYEEYAAIAKTEQFLGVTAKVQTEEEVTHLIAESLWRPDLDARPESGGSHDFH